MQNLLQIILGTNNSIFGGSGTSSTAGFGQSASFGAAAAPPNLTTNAFMNPQSSQSFVNPTSTSVFGGAVSTSGSVFGGTVTTSAPNTGTVFGQSATAGAAFGGAPVFGGAAAFGASQVKCYFNLWLLWFQNILIIFRQLTSLLFCWNHVHYFSRKIYLIIYPLLKNYFYEIIKIRNRNINMFEEFYKFLINKNFKWIIAMQN